MTGRAATLRSVPLFARLREEDLTRVANAATVRRYARQSMIRLDRDGGDGLYVLLGGQVKLVLTSEDGREIILATRTKGDFFGEMSLIDDQPTPFDAITMADSELLILRREDFLRCLADIPGMSLGLLRALCGRLRQADSRIGGLVFLDVKGRVARLLLELTENQPTGVVPRGFTHNVLAQMIGATRETVSRTISELSEAGAIETARTKVTIKNRDMLKAAARFDVLPLMEAKVETAAVATAAPHRRSTDSYQPPSSLLS